MVRVRRVALLGYPAVGKSSLAYQFVEGRFSDEYCTTIDNHLTYNTFVEGDEYELHLHDTMGVSELPAFPEHIYTMDGWILVYSVENGRSFDVVREIYDKLRMNIDRPPLVLVGNKTDLTSKREVSVADGKSLAGELDAFYLESSAKDDTGVKLVFELMIKQINLSRGDTPQKTKSSCLLS